MCLTNGATTHLRKNMNKQELLYIPFHCIIYCVNLHITIRQFLSYHLGNVK